MHDAELELRDLLDLRAHVSELFGLHAGHLDEDAVITLRLHGEILCAFGVQTLFQDGHGLLHGGGIHALSVAFFVRAGLQADDELATTLEVDAERDAHVFKREHGKGRHQDDQSRPHTALGGVHHRADVKQQQQQDGGSDEEGGVGVHGLWRGRLGLGK